MMEIPGYLILVLVVLAAVLGAGYTALSSGGEEYDGEGLVFITEEYPPYNYLENGTPTGIAVDLLVAAGPLAGTGIVPGEVRVLPWSDAYRTALTRNNTVLFSTVRLPEREDLFSWAGPLGTDRKVVFAEPETASLVSSPSDLARYRIGVVADDAAAGQLRALGVDPSELVEKRDVPALIAAMEAGEIDLWCSGDLAGRYFTGEVTGDPDRYGIAWVLESRDLYFAFSRDTPSSTVDAFQAALDTLRNEPDQAGVTAYQAIAYRYLGVSHLPDPPVTAGRVMDLVNLTAHALEEDTPGTLARINAGEHPYWDRENRALYVFVYDTRVTIVAEADNPRLIGVNMRGKTDIRGVPFRDRIVERALAGGSGWQDYLWMIPERNGIYEKSAYFRLVNGTDGKQYIVVSGMYTS